MISKSDISSSKIIFNTTTTQEWIYKAYHFAKANNMGLAAWKLPNKDEFQVIIDQNGGEAISQVELEELQEGFIISPYNPQLHKSVFLSKQFFLKHPLKKDFQLADEYAEKNQALLEQIDQTDYREAEETPSISKPFSDIEKREYIELVERSIKEIEQGAFQKVVPSRVKTFKTEEPVQIAKAFFKACCKYSNAFVSLTFSPISGTWLGATPEILVKQDENGLFETVALAGTQQATEKPLMETSWTQKEIEEQALVARYIINCFKKIRLRDFNEIGPKTVQAGNLLHLKTFFSVDTQSVNFPQLASVMLKLLHPTSAVCGMPKEEAENFLSHQEKHNRAYFSGFLGPVGISNNTQLFVNLRCCRVEDQAVSFFAGAGITQDSIPEKEWLETEMKCKVLAEVVFN